MSERSAGDMLRQAVSNPVVDVAVPLGIAAAALWATKGRSAGLADKLGKLAAACRPEEDLAKSMSKPLEEALNSMPLLPSIGGRAQSRLAGAIVDSHDIFPLTARVPSQSQLMDAVSAGGQLRKVDDTTSIGELGGKLFVFHGDGKTAVTLGTRTDYFNVLDHNAGTNTHYNMFAGNEFVGVGRGISTDNSWGIKLSTGNSERRISQDHLFRRNDFRDAKVNSFYSDSDQPVSSRLNELLGDRVHPALQRQWTDRDDLKDLVRNTVMLF